MNRTFRVFALALTMTATVTAAGGRKSVAPHAMRDIPGWALGGAVLGFVAAPLTMGLAVGSAATTGQQVPSLPLGIGATLTFGIAVPFVAMASGSVRSGAGVPGSLGLRIAAWSLYGVTLGLAVVAVVLGVTVTVPAPVIIGLGVGGTASSALMAIEALVARGQAKELISEDVAESGPAFQIAPYASIVSQPGGHTAPMVGIVGLF